MTAPAKWLHKGWKIDFYKGIFFVNEMSGMIHHLINQFSVMAENKALQLLLN